jgi:CRISPR-associated endonuclease Csn1
MVLKKGLNVILYKNQIEEIDFSDNMNLISRLYKITGLDDDGIKLIYNHSAKSTTANITYMNEVINEQKLYEVKKELDFLGIWDKILFDLKNVNFKTADIFKSLNSILNNYYKENEISDAKGIIKESKIKESALSTPKGGDVIDNHIKFPYIKFKVSNFNALIEGIDFKISSTGKILKI